MVGAERTVPRRRSVKNGGISSGSSARRRPRRAIRRPRNVKRDCTRRWHRHVASSRWPRPGERDLRDCRQSMRAAGRPDRVRRRRIASLGGRCRLVGRLHVSGRQSGGRPSAGAAQSDSRRVARRSSVVCGRRRTRARRGRPPPTGDRASRPGCAGSRGPAAPSWKSRTTPGRRARAPRPRSRTAPRPILVLLQARAAAPPTRARPKRQMVARAAGQPFDVRVVKRQRVGRNVLERQARSSARGCRAMSRASARARRTAGRG